MSEGVWRIDNRSGWLEGHAGFRRVDSPNFDPRPLGMPVELLVIHNISLPPDQFGGPGVEQLFTNTLDPAEHPYYAEIQGMQVSAHFFIRRDGSLIQFVSCLDRAWHAGASHFGRDGSAAMTSPSASSLRVAIRSLSRMPSMRP